MHDTVGRAWVNACAELGAVACTTPQNVTKDNTSKCTHTGTTQKLWARLAKQSSRHVIHGMQHHWHQSRTPCSWVSSHEVALYPSSHWTCKSTSVSVGYRINEVYHPCFMFSSRWVIRSCIIVTISVKHNARTRRITSASDFRHDIHVLCWRLCQCQGLCPRLSSCLCPSPHLAVSAFSTSPSIFMQAYKIHSPLIGQMEGVSHLISTTFFLQPTSDT